MTEQTDFILLKWGTLKGWDFTNSPEAQEALKEYAEIGYSGAGAMMQEDTPRQKELLCIMIDKVNGSVSSTGFGDMIIYELLQQSDAFWKLASEVFVRDSGEEE